MSSVWFWRTKHRVWQHFKDGESTQASLWRVCGGESDLEPEPEKRRTAYGGAVRCVIPRTLTRQMEGARQYPTKKSAGLWTTWFRNSRPSVALQAYRDLVHETTFLILVGTSITCQVPM